MSSRRLALGVLIAVAAVIHVGTALLRVRVFWPYPTLVDFSGFYAAAAAMRLGLSPYALPDTFLTSLQRSAELPFRPPPIFNPPAWPFLLQPLSWLSFPPAAWIWLLFQLAILSWCALTLGHLAGIRGRGLFVVALITVTFGPVFLDLTLGQTSILLLFAGLIIGRSLSPERKLGPAAGAAAQSLAIAAKLYPTFWIGAFVLRRRWRILALSMLLTAGLFLGVGLLKPEGSRAYWLQHLPDRITSATSQAGVDDQSLPAWLERVFLPQSFATPALSATERRRVQWTPFWRVEPQVPRAVGYLILGLILATIGWVSWQATSTWDEPVFYLWLLVGLLAFPHTERYNHTLLLPSMAWLWGQGTRGQSVVIVAYFMAALSRLTHLWAIFLPAPWGPLASGFGLYAVLFLGVAMVASLQFPQSMDTACQEELQPGRRAITME
jgi:alpha-1,2-mannosyltransferase